MWCQRNQEGQRFRERMVGLVDCSKISSKCTTTKDVMGFNDMKSEMFPEIKGLSNLVVAGDSEISRGMSSK